jgi:hypothetical protein
MSLQSKATANAIAPSAANGDRPRSEEGWSSIASERGVTDSLRWWRTRPAEGFRAADLETLRDALFHATKSTDPLWKAAVHGNAAAAIGFAVRVVWRGERSGISRDAALSAVLACALEGDAAAIFLLSAALRRPGGCGVRRASLAGSWLIASLSSPPLAPGE